LEPGSLVCPLFFSHLARAMTITRARLPGFVAEMWVITRWVGRLLDVAEGPLIVGNAEIIQIFNPILATVNSQPQ
ncbi:hypothetical protein, partial [Paraburkholderia dilworthii]|uniref:hypothetical protein n=1 Tax=Paraburkholderia dilworthii TaxID=948106 RepID=UPI00056C6E01